MTNRFQEPNLNLVESSAMEFSSRLHLTARRSRKAYQIEGALDRSKVPILSLLMAEEETLRRAIPGEDGRLVLGKHVTLLLPGSLVEASGKSVKREDLSGTRILFCPEMVEGHRVDLLISQSGDEEFPIVLDWSSVQDMHGGLKKAAIQALLDTVEAFISRDLPSIVLKLGL